MIGIGILWLVTLGVLVVLELRGEGPDDAMWKMEQLIKDKNAIIDATARELVRLQGLNQELKQKLKQKNEEYKETAGEV